MAAAQEDNLLPVSHINAIWALGKSPINVHKLKQYLSNYPHEKNAAILSNGFSKGFRLFFTGSKGGTVANNLTSATLHADAVRIKLKKEVDLGRVAGPFRTPPIANLKISPIGVVPKSDGNWRLITHLSHPVGSSVNDGFDDNLCSVSYTSFDKVADLVFKCGKGALMAKRDIKSAFRLLPVFPGDFHLLGMKFEDNFYFDKCLPMGCSRAPMLFETFSTFIHWCVAYKSGLQTLDHFLDDFIFVGSNKTDECVRLAVTFEQICSELEIPVAAEKSVGPTTVLVFLGLELDSNEMLVRVPLHKIEELLELLQSYASRKKMSLKELQSIVGKLSFVSRAVRSSRAFLRRFYDAMSGLKKPHYKLRINQELRADFLMWVEFLNNFNGVVYIPDAVWYENSIINLYTDSAGGASLGCGCYFAGQWAFFQWPKIWGNSKVLTDITFLEMVPVLLAVMLWGDRLRNMKIVLRIDNEALVHVINKQSCKSKRTMILLRKFILLAMKHSIIFRAMHISTTSNFIADSISRKQWDRFSSVAPDANKLPEPLPKEFQSFICNMRPIDY